MARIKGPWRMSHGSGTEFGNSVWADGGDGFFRIPICSIVFGVDEQQRVEHARLLAAAPELLAACEALLAVSGDDRSDKYEAAKSLASYTIKKAKGE